MNAAKKPDMSWLSEGVSTAIRKHRVRLGISQEEFSKRCGLHRTYISDIERGARNMSLRNIQRLAEALGVMPSQLIGEAECLRTANEKTVTKRRWRLRRLAL